MLNKSDKGLLILLNENMERFIKVVNESSEIKGLKWDDLLLRFEWSFELDKIKDFIENKASVLSKIDKAEIKESYIKLATKFDLETIK